MHEVEDAVEATRNASNTRTDFMQALADWGPGLLDRIRIRFDVESEKRS